MDRGNYYSHHTPRALGAVYAYLLKRMENGENSPLLIQERKRIEQVAKEKGISLLELRQLGNWITEKEINLTKEESLHQPE